MSLRGNTEKVIKRAIAKQLIGNKMKYLEYQIIIPFIRHSKTELINSTRKSHWWLPGVGQLGRLTANGAPGNFWGDGNIYLDWGGGYIHVYICQKSSTCSLKTHNFYCI